MSERKESEEETYLRSLLAENVTVPAEILSKVFNVSAETISKISKEVRRETTSATSPLSWDYAMVFEVGDENEVHKPTKKEFDQQNGSFGGYDKEWQEGMSERKYFSQIVLQTQKELEEARLSTKLFRHKKRKKKFFFLQKYTSQDQKFVIMLIGITEDNLNRWADDRDTDLELEPSQACREGRRREFPLALRTYLVSYFFFSVYDEQDDPARCSLPLENWSCMYAQYNPKAQKSIYRQYNRLRDNDSIKTCFDEKTRLRIIYESIIEDKGEAYPKKLSNPRDCFEYVKKKKKGRTKKTRVCFFPKGGAEIEIQEHIASPTHPLVACFPLHNPKELEEFSTKWVKNWAVRDLLTVPLSDIRAYFGEPTAFYYGFMMFYLRWLIAPSIVGIGFFIAQLVHNEVDVPGLFLLSLFIILWCVAFVEFWVRQESRYRLLWGMTKFQTKAVARPEFKGEWQHDRVSGLWVEDYSFLSRFFKGLFVYSGLSTWMAGCVVAVIYILLFRDKNPTDLGLKIGLGVSNGVMISVFDYVYQFASQYGNQWENHRTEQDFQDALISKSFVFKFFNSFSSLFYLSFIRPFAKG
ncbi:anoctamin-10 [Reticulomyxa filosa]|uniref:Anoctamin-10 n=1 Tax=Reticulomyxa filosa TaxID=46433 RepID=X6P1H7_RETFI|nr:anoctamin-10 [Reticulomyxa filosa]|eukprot:ETO32380.1 anoctamin-10 [Reticulomyxa filosa]